MSADKKTIKLFTLIQGLQIGGLEKMAVDLVNNLPSHYQTTLCCFDDLGPLAKDLNSDIEVLMLPRKPGMDLLYFHKLAKAMGKRSIDVFHAHNNTAFFYGTVAAKLARVGRIVFTEHGRTERLSFKARTMHRVISKFVDQTVIVADYLKDVLVKDEGFSKDRIKLIPNGINDEPYNQDHDPALFREELGLNPENKLIGIVARLDPIKNHSLLIKAMETVQEKEPNARLIVVGDGPLKENLLKEASDTVLFLGERDDVPRILKCLDIFVLCSFSEGMSLTLVEAMAAKLPIIATDVGGNPKLIKTGVNGLLTPSDDKVALSEAILSLLKDKEFSKRLAEQGRLKFESEYLLKTMVKKYCDVFESK